MESGEQSVGGADWEPGFAGLTKSHYEPGAQVKTKQKMRLG